MLDLINPERFSGEISEGIPGGYFKAASGISGETPGVFYKKNFLKELLN